MDNLPDSVYILTIKTGTPDGDRFHVRRKLFFNFNDAKNYPLPDTHKEYSTIHRLSGLQAYRLKYLNSDGSINEEALNG